MSDLPNSVIAAAFDELGDLYELDGAIVHRVVAYRSAARSVRDAPTSVAALARAGRATELPGIGRTLQEKIQALIETGTIPAAERLRAKFPAGLIELTRLPGLGPKRARQLYEQLGIDSLAALRDAALDQRLRSVRGLGEKFEAGVLSALDAGLGERPARRVLLPRALELGEAIVAGLRDAVPGVRRLELAGSVRRRGDSVKDLDVVAASDRPAELISALNELDLIESVGAGSAQEPTREAGARARTHTGLAVDLRIVSPPQHGNLLQHLTGSNRHNAALREAAVRRGLHVSEYGVLDDSTGVTTACASEAEVYALLGLAFIEPELREDRGELQAAALDGGAGLPALIKLADMRGDLHCHTVASDGHNTIEEMARAALARGYQYLAITDHSASHGFGNHVSPDELRRQIERVREVDARLEGIRVLAGSEVNVLPDGSLDYADDLLAELDWIVASVHTAFATTEQAITERMIRAVEHPLVDLIGHPTGRLIERRTPYDVDLGAVFAAAARCGTMLEINANPDRRDLSDVAARAAMSAGVTLVIDSDAHRTATLANMRWGVATARRAWASADRVANTRSWGELQTLRKPGRGARPDS
jgi:DNA polymerase (family 10)